MKLTFPAAALVCLLAACDKPQPRAYDAPADAEPPVQAPPLADRPAHELPEWEPPANWEATAAQPPLLARFALTADGGTAEVTVTAFPGDVGGRAANVNRWRRQLGLSPIGDEEANAAITETEYGGRMYWVTEIAGAQASTLVGATKVDADTWFFKMTGDTSAVDAERAPFARWLDSIRFSAR